MAFLDALLNFSHWLSLLASTSGYRRPPNVCASLTRSSRTVRTSSRVGWMWHVVRLTRVWQWGYDRLSAYSDRWVGYLGIQWLEWGARCRATRPTGGGRGSQKRTCIDRWEWGAWSPVYWLVGIGTSLLWLMYSCTLKFTCSHVCILYHPHPYTTFQYQIDHIFGYHLLVATSPFQ